MTWMMWLPVGITVAALCATLWALSRAKALCEQGRRYVRAIQLVEEARRRPLTEAEYRCMAEVEVAETGRAEASWRLYRESQRRGETPARGNQSTGE